MSSTGINKKVLIMAGGTGGHVFPALSIANYLIDAGVTVEWLGTKSGLESKIIGATDIPIHNISITGLRGKSMWKKMLSPIVIVIAVIQAVVKVAKVKPNCVLGMGGFVTGPGGVAARLLGTKLCIHEQNAIAGVSNQILAPLAYKVMEAFPGSFERKENISKNIFLKYLSRNIKPILIGNPVREEILNCPIPEERYKKASERLQILVVGGSLGAVAINEVIPQLLALYNNEEMPLVIHQCGANNLKNTKQEYVKHKLAINDEIVVKEFIDDMADAYCWADLIICRAGALTVAEISNIGIPSILIPYPWAVDDHQTHNAQILVLAGGANIIQQVDLSVEKLAEIVKGYQKDKSLLLQQAKAVKKIAKQDATMQAAEVCMEACNAK